MYHVLALVVEVYLSSLRYMRGGTRGGASVVVVVGAAVGRVIGGREKGPGGELNDVGFLIFSSLIFFMHKKIVDREELQFYSRYLAKLQSYLIQVNKC